MKLDNGSENLMNRRNRVIAAVIGAAVAFVLLFVLTELAARRTYSSYEAVKVVEKNGNVSQYAVTDDGILRYSADGAALLDSGLDAVWNLTFTMTNINADICGNEILLYDRQGTDMFICNENGRVSSFSTNLPVLNARISKEDTVAALLDDGNTVEFVYYTKDGREIASGKSGISDPGYASGIAVSRDGINVCISYLTVDGGKIGSVLRFYNFSSEKKESGENLVKTEKIDGVLIPEVEYLGTDVLAAFGDSEFVIYRDGEQVRTAALDDEALSLFYDGSRIGFVFRSDDSAHTYKMQLYSISGKPGKEIYFDGTYTDVRMSGGQIILNDSSSFSVYTARGICRFSGEVKEGSVSTVMKMGSGRYLIVTDQLVEEVRLK